MAPEVRWQASSAAARSGSDIPASDQDTVESLLRRLIRRIEESERRYAEALDELQARLGHVSYSAAVTEVIGTPEETETLERLRLQLSALARRLEQRPEPQAEVNAVSAGLAVPEPDWFASSRPSPRPPAAEPEPAFSPSQPESITSDASPSLGFPPVSEEQADFDRRLIEMAQRLERSIGEAMPAAAIETLNTRMEEISARFQAALEQTPKLETLRHIERQVADMGQQLGRAEQHIARIGAVEDKLQKLIERIDAAPAQMERAASKAAQETARLVGETGLDKPSAAERLDALHRDIVAMNERNTATDDHLVDSLVAMHDSLKGLMRQGEQNRAWAMAAPQAQLRMGRTPNEPAPVTFAPPAPPVPTPPATETAPSFELAKRAPSSEEASAERSLRGPAFIRDIDSTEDLVAAARRAAQAAAARAEERDALRLRPALANELKRATDEPGRHKVSLLMVVAALLLMISAALLVTRLKLKPDFYVPPPAAEQRLPAPAEEAPAVPEAPFQPEVTPNPEADPAPPAAAAPGTAPESEPEAPTPAPAAPRAITPSANPVHIQAAPPVRTRRRPRRWRGHTGAGFA